MAQSMFAHALPSEYKKQKKAKKSKKTKKIKKGKKKKMKKEGFNRGTTETPLNIPNLDFELTDAAKEI